MNLEVAQDQLGDQIRRHPDRLLDVFKSMLRMHKEVKHFRLTDTDAALMRIDRIMNQIHILKQVTVGTLQIRQHGKWAMHLNRIYQNCEQEKQEIMMSMESEREALECESGAGTSTEWSRTLLSEWNCPTLQEHFVQRLVSAIVLPILHPSLGDSGANVLVVGPSLSGKTYTLRKVREYLHGRARVDWSEWGAYRFAREAEYLVSQGGEGDAREDGLSAGGDGAVDASAARTTSGADDRWRVYVVDKVGASDVAHWRKQAWFRSWCNALRASPRRVWVVLYEGEDGGDFVDATTVDDDDSQLRALRELLDVHVEYRLPSGRTLYEYLRSLLRERFGEASSRAPCVRLPIEQRLSELGRLASVMQTRGANFTMVRRWFECACERVGRAALLENVAYEVRPGVWLPRNSVHIDRLSEYSYALVYPLGNDRVEFSLAGGGGGTAAGEPAGASREYWNCQLMDRMPSTDLDRFANIYIDPETVDSETYDIVANFETTTDLFAHHLDHGWAPCFEYVVAFWFTMWGAVAAANASRYEVLNRMAGFEYLCGWIAQLSQLEAIITVRDIPSVSAKRLRRWLAFDGGRDGGDAPAEGGGRGRASAADTVGATLSYLCGENEHLAHATSPFQILYVERDEAVARAGDDDDEAFAQRQFHIMCGERSTELHGEHGAGIPCNVRAESLRATLDALIGRKDCCEVLQVRTSRGYSYHLMFRKPLQYALECRGAGGVVARVLPRLQLLDCGSDLPASYCVTNESDIDVLQDRYPQEYKGLYRDDEETWKMKPLRDPSHVRYLNSKYSCEVKFYLRLYCTLLKLKASQYSGMSHASQQALDELLTELRNYVDFVLLIIPENDAGGKWNALWSMSRNHRLEQQYHLAEGDDADPITINMATDWMEKGMECHVSVRLFDALFRLCAACCDRGPRRSYMEEIYDAWHAHAGQMHDRTRKWMYVKSTIPRTLWREAGGVSHLLRAETKKMVTDPQWMSHYVARCKASLFHQVMARATHIGCASSEGIRWYTFGEWDGAAKLLSESLRKRQAMWSLMASGTAGDHGMRALFAMVAASCAKHPSWQHFYAHLLCFSCVGYWDADAHRTLFDSEFVRHTLARLVERHRFVHRHVYRRESPVSGAVPRGLQRARSVTAVPHRVDRRRRVMTEKEVQQLCVYGMAVHHVEDCMEA